MALGRTYSIALVGLNGYIVEVEADIGQTLPAFILLGLPDASLNEAKERIRSAAKNSGIPLSRRKITANLIPASLPKRGSGFDLAVTMAVLRAANDIKQTGKTVFIAELGLDGRLRPVRGILPAVMASVQAGYPDIVVAQANLAEAALVPGAKVRGYRTLARLALDFGADPQELALDFEPEDPHLPADEQEDGGFNPDMADVSGQGDARRALEVAAAGAHHLLLMGPPGAGKTMLAERLPGLLPDLADHEAMEVTAIHSLCSLPSSSAQLLRRPPFESPHHSATAAAIIGGGSGLPRPGAASRAHRGVLFVDEASNLGHTTHRVNESSFADPVGAPFPGSSLVVTDHCRVDFIASLDLAETLKLFGAILGALIASRTIGAGVRNWYLRGWGSRRVWRKKLNQMAIGATEEYVEDLLGKPVFRNYEGPNIWEADEEKPKWVDHIFSTPHAWVVTRRVKDQLESWSVTITDPKFWWDLGDVTFGIAKGKLGRATFRELVEHPSGKYESYGARSAVYAESAYFGNPGAYQTFIFMYNQEGVGTFKSSGSGDVQAGEFERPDEKSDWPAPEDDSHRSQTTVNTVIVTWHSTKITHNPWQSWPIAISDQMRLLHRYQKKRGWKKKRSLGGGNGK